MPKDAKEEHRSFTVRVPLSLYERIGDMASADGVFVNQKVNQLIRLGMKEHVNLDQAVARLLKKELSS